MSTDNASKWTVPVVGTAAGIIYLVIMLIRGEPLMGFILLGIMLAYVAVVVGLSKRSEAGAVLRGTATDERQRENNTKAVALTCHVLILAILGGAVFTMATDSSAFPIWGGLAALGGGTYILATVALSRWG